MRENGFIAWGSTGRMKERLQRPTASDTLPPVAGGRSCRPLHPAALGSLPSVALSSAMYLFSVRVGQGEHRAEEVDEVLAALVTGGRQAGEGFPGLFAAESFVSAGQLGGGMIPR